MVAPLPSAPAIPDARGLNLFRAALYGHLEPHFDHLGTLAADPNLALTAPLESWPRDAMALSTCVQPSGLIGLSGGLGREREQVAFLAGDAAALDARLAQIRQLAQDGRYPAAARAQVRSRWPGL